MRTLEGIVDPYSFQRFTHEQVGDAGKIKREIFSRCKLLWQASSLGAHALLRIG